MTGVQTCALPICCMYDGEVVKYVNDRAPIKTERDVVINILESYVNFSHEGEYYNA